MTHSAITLCHFFSYHILVLAICVWLLNRCTPNIKDAPMATHLVLFFYYSRYWAWCMDERIDGQSHDNQIFLDWWVAKFSKIWGSTITRWVLISLIKIKISLPFLESLEFLIELTEIVTWWQQLQGYAWFGYRVVLWWDNYLKKRPRNGMSTGAQKDWNQNGQNQEHHLKMTYLNFSLYRGVVAKV